MAVSAGRQEARSLETVEEEEDEEQEEQEEQDISRRWLPWQRASIVSLHLGSDTRPPQCLHIRIQKGTKKSDQINYIMY